MNLTSLFEFIDDSSICLKTHNYYYNRHTYIFIYKHSYISMYECIILGNIWQIYLCFEKLAKFLQPVGSRFPLHAY